MKEYRRFCMGTSDKWSVGFIYNAFSYNCSLWNLLLTILRCSESQSIAFALAIVL